MTPSRLRTKLKKIRDWGEETAEEGGELNIIPFLDIVTNIIMFMLATVTFAAALGVINVSSPQLGGAGGGGEPDRPPLNLTVSISEAGFTIAASGAVLGKGFSFDATGNLINPSSEIPSLPKKAGDYDYDGLTKTMAIIHSSAAAEGETKVILNANPSITYDIVINTMDAVRQEGAKVLFPDVLMSAGVN